MIIWYCDECGSIDQEKLERRQACPECGKSWTIFGVEEE